MIRYDQAYNQKISRVVSNFNRKVRRLEKEEAELLPSTVRVREIKDMFMNRRDLNTLGIFNALESVDLKKL